MPAPPVHQWPRLWVAVVVAALAALAILAQAAQDSPHPGGPEQTTRTLSISEPHSRIEVLIGRLDGAFTFELARDPSLELLERNTHGDRAEVAYRAARPLTGWIAWVMSAGGRRELVGPALIVLTAVSFGAVVWAVQWACVPGPARWPVAAALMPGMLIALIAPGLVDQPAAALAVAAVAAHRHRLARTTVILLTLAVLARESTILVAGAITLSELWQTRKVRALLPSLVPAVVFTVWNLAVWRMVGASILDASHGTLTAPGMGLAAGISRWGSLEVATGLALFAAVAALVSCPDRVLRLVAITHIVFGLVMVEMVWKVWWGFGRVLLPVQVLAVVAYSLMNSEGRHHAHEMVPAVGR